MATDMYGFVENQGNDMELKDTVGYLGRIASCDRLCILDSA